MLPSKRRKIEEILERDPERRFCSAEFSEAIRSPNDGTFVLMLQHHNQSRYVLPFDTILSAILLAPTPIVPFTQLLENSEDVQIYEWFIHSVIQGKHVDLMYKLLQLYFQPERRRLDPFFAHDPIERIEKLIVTYCRDKKIRTVFFALIDALKPS